MAMKIVLVVAIVMALGHVTGQSCQGRSDKRRIYSMIQKTSCMDPHLSLVPLPVPDGFDFVQPSVAKLFQCTGLHCGVFPEKCLPVPRNTTKHTFKVEAKYRNGIKSKCVAVTVEEHNACQCRCDVLTCSTNMVFNEQTCECECNPHLRMMCMLRREMHEDSVMWSEDTCSCVCDTPRKCDSSMSYWDSSQCRCVDM